MGLGLGHLVNSSSSNTYADYADAQRRRTSSNFIEGLLSDPARWGEVLQNSVKEDIEQDDAEQLGLQPVK